MDETVWDERYRSTDLVWGSEPNQFVRQLCEGLPIGVAVDLACGEGRNTLWLARLGWQVEGIDFSAVGIARARQLEARESPEVRDRVTWRVADVTASPPQPTSVDLVVISYVHLVEVHRYALVRASVRALRPAGHLVVVGHDRRNLADGVGGPQDPNLLYQPDELAGWIRAEGLEVERAETVDRVTSAGVALDTLVCASRPAPPPMP